MTSPQTLDEAISAAAENIQHHYPDFPLSQFALHNLISDSIVPLIRNVFENVSIKNSSEVDHVICEILDRLLVADLANVSFAAGEGS